MPHSQSYQPRQLELHEASDQPIKTHTRRKTRSGVVVTVYSDLHEPLPHSHTPTHSRSLECTHKANTDYLSNIILSQREKHIYINTDNILQRQ